MTTIKPIRTYWLTYSRKGPCDPDGFYCEDCFRTKLNEEDHNLGMATVVNPENTPYYRCRICEKDYRD